MNRKSNVFIGVILVVLGALFFSKNILNFDFNIGHLIALFWPTLFLIVPGLIFHLSYFGASNRDAGLLVPGGILLFGGLSSQTWMIFHIPGIIWTGFIISVAIGLFELYLFGNRDAGLMVPVGILTVTGLTSQMSTFFNAWGFLWPGFIFSVAVGLFGLYLFGNREKGLLIPITILTGLSVVFFGVFTLGWVFSYRFGQLSISLLLVLVGIFVIFKNRIGKSNY